MSDKTDDLILSISTDVATLRRSLKKVEAAIGDTTGVAARKFDKLGQDIDRSMSKSLGKAGSAINRLGGVAGAAAGRIAGVFAAGASLQAASRLADAAKNAQNALKVAGLEGAALTDVYDKLFASAQRNAAPIEALVTLYSRASGSARELGASQADLLKFSDKVAVALKVSGQSAGEASGALLQLSQLLGGGTVQMEEFGSLLDGGRPILQAVAAGLEDAGGSVAALTKLVKDGKVSSEAFFRAFLEGSKTLDEKVAGAATTTAQQFVRLQNVLVDTAGKIDTATGASDRFGSTIEELASTIEGFGKIVVQASDSELGTFVGWLSEGVDKASEFKRMMGGIPGIFDKLGKLNHDLFNGKPLGTAITEDAIQGRIEGAFEGTGAAPKTSRLPAAVPTVPVKPVKLSDYPVDDAKSKPGKEKKVELDDFARELAQIKERTAALNAAYAAQAALNPLVDDYGFAVDKAAAAHELLAAAMAAGKANTPALAAEIDAAAEAYARATSAAERLAEQQQKVRDKAEEAGEAVSGVLMAGIKAAVDGEKIGRAIADAAIGGHFVLKLEFLK
ncbi:tape measure protein [Pararhizobium gei]|uniref:tape measure protein n=1 Tax=Pararhizobium gei TaxID=1395951 RepID=UPI0023DCEAA9|nr:tape measure protein [Rhizobium gei]